MTESTSPALQVALQRGEVVEVLLVRGLELQVGDQLDQFRRAPVSLQPIALS